MVRRALNICAAVAVAALVGCERPSVEVPANPDTPLESEVAAAVDDVTLTWGELTRMAPTDDLVAYREAVQAFIFTTLLVKEAQAHGIVLDDAAWRDFSAQFAEAAGLSPEAYAAAHGGEGTLVALRAEALGWLFLDRVVYRGLAVPEEDLAADRARVAAEAAEARRRMEGFQTQVALGADFAALVREHSGVTAPIRVSLGEMEASWPPELVLRVTGIPVGAVTDIVEFPGMLAMYQVAAREGEDFTLRVLALPLPTPNEALDDYLLLWRREEAYWAWFEEACHRHRVRCPLFPDLAPAQ